MAALEFDITQQMLAKLAGQPGYPERTKKVLVDTIVVMVKGAQEPEIRRLATMLATPQGEAWLLAGTNLRTTPERAALVNAAGATFLELDEGVRPTGHPGVHVVPALLAEVESRSRDVTMKTLLESLLIGYEVVSRLAASLKFGPTVHPHGHIGSVGVAAAIGYMRGWSAESIANCMAIAASLPLRTDWRACFTGDTVRNIYAGMGASTGILAADFAEAGFTGEWGAIEHILASAVGDGIEVEKFLHADPQWGIERGYHKFYAGCALTHPSTEAALSLYGRGPWNLDSIATVEVFVPERYMRTAGMPNGTRLSAKFSTPWAVAGALLYGVADDSLYQAPLMDDQDLKRLARRVHVQSAPDLTARFPESAGSHIDLVLTSGERIAAYCEEPYGGVQRATSWEDLHEKARALLLGVPDDWWQGLSRFSDQDRAADWWNTTVRGVSA